MYRELYNENVWTNLNYELRNNRIAGLCQEFLRQYKTLERVLVVNYNFRPVNNETLRAVLTKVYNRMSNVNAPFSQLFHDNKYGRYIDGIYKEITDEGIFGMSIGNMFYKRSMASAFPYFRDSFIKVETSEQYDMNSFITGYYSIEDYNSKVFLPRVTDIDLKLIIEEHQKAESFIRPELLHVLKERIQMLYTIQHHHKIMIQIFDEIDNYFKGIKDELWERMEKRKNEITVTEWEKEKIREENKINSLAERLIICNNLIYENRFKS